MMESLCGTCSCAREIVSGTGSRFLLCQKSQADRRYPKYPPQPVIACEGYQRIENRVAAATEDFCPKSAALRLDHFLRLSGVADTGGQAKLLIQGGEAKVNGQIETRRRRKLVEGDEVEVGGRKWVVGST